MNQYLIPANSKKGQLIFNVFRWIDLVILLIGAFVTFILLFVIPGQSIPALFIKLLPIGVCVLLVMPVPYYHNVLVFLQELYLYYSIKNPKKLLWRGWCSKQYGQQNK